MDPVTHTLLGTAAAEAAGAAGLYEGGYVAAAIGAALLPDSDFVVRYLGPTATIRFHHGPTHSFVGGAVLSLLWASAVFLVPRLVIPGWSPPFFAVAAFSYLGFLSHICLDIILHNNGTQLFWPFSRRWVRFPLVIGINPLTASARCGERSLFVCGLCQLNGLVHNPVFYILLAGNVLMLAFWPLRTSVGAVTVLGLIIYVAFRLIRRVGALKLAKNMFVSADAIEVFPAGYGSRRWLAVASRGNDYTVASLDLTRGAAGTPAVFRYDASPEIAAAAENKHVKAVLNNYIVAYPFVRERRPSATEIWCRDLAYFFTPDVDLHLAKIKVSDSGEVSSVDFQERW
jgi:membrane-bound metal-dependent hydrolase YbcI (DUF457 family)